MSDAASTFIKTELGRLASTFFPARPARSWAARGDSSSGSSAAQRGRRSRAQRPRLGRRAPAAAAGAARTARAAPPASAAAGATGRGKSPPGAAALATRACAGWRAPASITAAGSPASFATSTPNERLAPPGGSLRRNTTSPFHSRAATLTLRTRGCVLGQRGQLVVVRGEQRLARRCGRAGARRPPRRSRRRRRSRCRGRSRRGRPGCARVAWRRMCAVSRISTMNVDSPRARLSPAPTRVKMRSHEADARARAPARSCPSAPWITVSATWRISVDLPAMLGPVTIRSCSAVGIEADVVGDEAAGAPPAARRPGGARPRAR